MKTLLSRLPATALIAGFLLLTSRLPAQVIGAESAVIGADSSPPGDSEVLTRGPVHEAFAAVVNYNPQAGLIVDRAPPEPIEEIPPEERPVGDDVAWIPGYWGWDDERSDFIWISGTWRSLPPGRAWIAGYWRDTGRGWQWVSGYWEDAGRREVTYLAPPPESLERGPSVAAPSPDDEWVPGCWEWRDTRYLWRPGYWLEARPEWVWVPSYYIWTPRGYVFVDGYWDYALADRGLLFAPVYYREHRGPRYEYRPSIVLNVAILSDYLFLRPNYGHYYFGDYYDSRYERSGFYATFSFQSSRRGYDPFYSHYRWEHRDDRDWDRRYREAYDYRRQHEDARPPRTWSGSTTVVNVININNRNSSAGNQRVTYAQPIQQYARANDTPVRVERRGGASRDQEVQLARQVQEQRTQRRTIESQPQASQPAYSRPGRPQPSRQIGAAQPAPQQQASAPVQLPVSPIVARAAPGGRQPPPKAQTPQPEDRADNRRPERPAASQSRANTGGRLRIGEGGLQADNSAQADARRAEEQPRAVQPPPAPQERTVPPAPGVSATQPQRPDDADAARREAERQAAQRNQAQQQQEPARQRTIGEPPQRAAENRQRLPQQQLEREQPEQQRAAEQAAQAQQRAAEQQQRAAENQQRAQQQQQQARDRQEEQQRQTLEQQAQQRAADQQEQSRKARDHATEQQRANEIQQQQRQAQQQQAQQERAAENQLRVQQQQQQQAERAREQQQQQAQQSQARERAAEQQVQARERAAEQQQRAAENQQQAQRQAQERAQQQAQERAADQQQQVQQRAEQQQQQAREQQARAAEQARAAREKAAPSREPPPKKNPPPPSDDDDDRKKKDGR
jgi:hypothetical protein